MEARSRRRPGQIHPGVASLPGSSARPAARGAAGSGIAAAPLRVPGAGCAS